MKTEKPYLKLRLGILKKDSRKKTKQYNCKYENKFSAGIPILSSYDTGMYWHMRLKQKEKLIDIFF